MTEEALTVEEIEWFEQVAAPRSWCKDAMWKRLLAAARAHLEGSTKERKLLSDLIERSTAIEYMPLTDDITPETVAAIQARADKVLSQDVYEPVAPPAPGEGDECHHAWIPSPDSAKLVERLRERYYSGHHDEAFDEAATALEALRKECEMLKKLRLDELADSQARIAELRLALEGLVRLLDAHEWGEGPDLRRARAALKEKE